MKDRNDFDVLIIGGGLAGLTNAIHLSKANINVLLVEKNNYPKHKVCGEYISNEVLPYLTSLDVDPFKLGAQRINRFLLSTPKSKTIEATLPLGGFGISRYTLDEALSKKARENGVSIIKDTVVTIDYINDNFQVSTKNKQQFTAHIVIGAYGKRDAIDMKLNRDFFKNESPFVAVKTHVKGDFPSDLVALHNFNGGYCGVSKVEKEVLNLCYIASYKSFKKFKDIQEFQENVVWKNTYLNEIFKNTEPLFKKPLTISQISFSKKKPVENHVLMCGDTAGMIHPLCGNGMSMAIRSAQLASQLILAYFKKEITSRLELENSYEKAWNNEFKKRINVGHVAASIFNMNHFSELALIGLKSFPRMLPKIIAQTHGKPMLAI